MTKIDYTIVIRTLGTSGEYYLRTLHSLLKQTIQPKAIIIYIAEGYPLPKVTVDVEKYVYVKKGMVAQRALRYDEVVSEYILFLDDDVYLPPTAIETLYKELKEYSGDVISPCVFYNHKSPLRSKIIKTITGKEICRMRDDKWAYRVLRNGGFSYNGNPQKSVYQSQTNAGPCFFCKKEDFLRIHFEEDLWLDEAPYALPEDQVMYYKMHLCGLKVLTSFDSGIVHMDAGSTMQASNEKILKIIYSEYRNKTIFWYKYIFSMEKNWLMKTWSSLCYGYAIGVQYIKSFLKQNRGKKAEVVAFRNGIADGWRYIINSR